MNSTSPSSSFLRALKRVLATGCAGAGLYAILLGPVGALGQDPTPTPTSTATAPATEQEGGASGSTEATEPAGTTTPAETPTSTPTEQSTPQSTPESTPTTEPESTATQAPSTGSPAQDEPVQDQPVQDGGTVNPRNLDGRKTGGGDGERGKCPAGRVRKPSTSGEGSRCVRRSAPERDRASSKGDRSGGRLIESSAPVREPDGTPTVDHPTFTLATPGAAPIGVPNFMIEKFRIPPFLLPIYQAAGMEYGVRWELLAAINEIETDYGRNLNVSSAGALGWMQFMPASWKAFGVDANRDGVKDPYNPVDAIFAAARYLDAHGVQEDVRRGIFAYNHADWYVDSVLLRARVIGGLPSNFVGSLTGLTQARFPVHAKASYAGSLDEEDAERRVPEGNAAFAVEGADRQGIEIFARRGAPVVAVNDGRVVKLGRNKRLGRFIKLQDVYGNVFTYARLGEVADTYPAPRNRSVTSSQIAAELDLPSPRGKRGGARQASKPQPRLASKERLFANPQRAGARAAGGAAQVAEASYRPTPGAPLKLNRSDYQAKPMRKGARVIAGTVLGRIGRTSERMAPHVLFEIRPAGRGAPRIDPKPILDGWKLLESTEIYRAAGRNPLFGRDARTPSIGQILLMSKDALIRRVLKNPRIEIYECGRQDVRVGGIDRRVLASLEFLAASGLKPTVSSLRCGRSSLYTASGNLSAHPSGNAVDIAAINGIPILGNQGRGSITEMAVQRLLTLQGTMRPNQIITLMSFEGADNTYAMGDHHDHIHVGWQPMYGTNSRAAKQVNAVLKPDQWIKLIDRLGDIENPEVRSGPAKHVLRVDRDKRSAVRGAPGRASDAHRGE